MASILDSIKTVAGDSHPFFKIGCFSALVFLVMQLNSVPNVDPFLKTTLMTLTILGFIGFAIYSVHNAVNEENTVVPSLLNPLKLIGIGILGSVSLLPYIAIAYYGITALMPILTFEPWINYALLLISSAFLTAFLVMGLVLFSKNFNPLEAYTVKYFFKYIGDFIVSNIVLFFYILLIGGGIFFPIGYGVKFVFNDPMVLNFYIIYSVIFIIMSMMQYYAQLHFEYISFKD